MAGREISLTLDGFRQQKLLSNKDSIAQRIINIMFMKPGHMPSMPHIGIDVNQYLYSQEGDINTSELKSKIISQCSELLPYIITGDISVTFTNDKGYDILLIAIPLMIESVEQLLLIGVSSLNSSATMKNNRNIVYEFTELL